MRNILSDRVHVAAHQLAAELGVTVTLGATPESLVAQIMGCPRREVSGVRPHKHGLAVTMFDASEYVIALRGAPDANGNAGILLAETPRYPMSVEVFRPGKPRPAPSPGEPAGSKRRRRHRVELDAPLDPVKAALDEIERVARQADPVGFAEAKLAEIQVTIAAGATDHVGLEKLKRAEIAARAELREARALVEAPALRADEVKLWSNAFLWARDLLAAQTSYEAEQVRRAWVQRWPTSARLTPHTAEHELRAATDWLASNAPDVLARLTADDVTVSA